MKATILVVDDDKNTRESLGAALREDNYRVKLAPDGETALDILRNELIDAVVADVMMGKISGMDILDFISAECPETAVIMVTGFATIESAVEAMKKGAYDYMTKPINIEKLNLLIQKALESNRLARENKLLREQLKERFSFRNIIGSSQQMQQIFRKIEQIASTDASTLIQGESGTGKELIASAIHYNSKRAEFPLVRVNCSALAEGVVESELFGHERGAFTGALRRHKGRFELADNGTLFLDEVGDLSPAIQIKLLRVLQEGEFERVGGSQTLRVDVRLIAATNQDLESKVEEGTFREDLYYRLKVITLNVPPLRERTEDIPSLVTHFIQSFNAVHNKQLKGISQKALNLMMRYHWPGNIRELKNCIESVVVLSRGDTVNPEDLPDHIREVEPGGEIAIRLGSTLGEIEKQVIMKTLAMVRGNKSQAAQTLGIGLKTLYRRLEEYQINF